MEVLNLSFNRIGNSGGIAIAQGLRTNTTLRSLNLAHNALTDEGARHFVNAMRTNGGLEQLLLHANHLTGEMLKQVEAAVVAGDPSTPPQTNTPHMREGTESLLLPSSSGVVARTAQWRHEGVSRLRPALGLGPDSPITKKENEEEGSNSRPAMPTRVKQGSPGISSPLPPPPTMTTTITTTQGDLFQSISGNQPPNRVFMPALASPHPSSAQPVRPLFFPTTPTATPTATSTATSTAATSPAAMTPPASVTVSASVSGDGDESSLLDVEEDISHAHLPPCRQPAPIGVSLTPGTLLLGRFRLQSLAENAFQGEGYRCYFALDLMAHSLPVLLYAYTSPTAFLHELSCRQQLTSLPSNSWTPIMLEPIMVATVADYSLCILPRPVQQLGALLQPPALLALDEEALLSLLQHTLAICQKTGLVPSFVQPSHIGHFPQGGYLWLTAQGFAPLGTAVPLQPTPHLAPEDARRLLRGGFMPSALGSGTNANANANANASSSSSSSSSSGGGGSALPSVRTVTSQAAALWTLGHVAWSLIRASLSTSTALGPSLSLHATLLQLSNGEFEWRELPLGLTSEWRGVWESVFQWEKEHRKWPVPSQQ
jgi:hypothetical protein